MSNHVIIETITESAQVLLSCLPQRRLSTWVVASRGSRGGPLEVEGIETKSHVLQYIIVRHSTYKSSVEFRSFRKDDEPHITPASRSNPSLGRQNQALIRPSSLPEANPAKHIRFNCHPGLLSRSKKSPATKAIMKYGNMAYEI